MFLVGALTVVLCMILRASDIVFRTSVLNSCSIIFIVGGEHIIAAVMLWIFSRLKKSQPIKLSITQWMSLIFIGCGVSVGGVWCFTKAFLYINPAIVILLQKLQPIVIILLSSMFLKEKINLKFLIFSILAIISAYFMSFGFLPIDFSMNLKGVSYALGAVCLWGAGTVVGKSLIADISPFDMSRYRYYIGAWFCLILFSCIYLGSFDNNIIKSNFETLISLKSNIFALVYMALISGGLLSLYLYYLGLKRITASLSGILELFYPISSVILSWLVLGYEFKWYELVFGSLVLVFMSFATFTTRSRS